MARVHGSPRARTHPTKFRARIQPDLRIQIVHALSQLDSCITALYIDYTVCMTAAASRRQAPAASPGQQQQFPLAGAQFPGGDG